MINELVYIENPNGSRDLYARVTHPSGMWGWVKVELLPSACEKARRIQVYEQTNSRYYEE